jgi:hypothetical protein
MRGRRITIYIDPRTLSRDAERVLRKVAAQSQGGPLPTQVDYQLRHIRKPQRVLRADYG